MKIKRYIISDRKVFMDNLEEELCKRNISYVKIENEIHFLDYVIFFYDLNLDLKLIVSSFFNDLFQEKQLNLGIQQIFNIENINNLQSESNITYQKRNKKVNKNESNYAKQKIKKYQNNSNKFFARKI